MPNFDFLEKGLGLHGHNVLELYNVLIQKRLTTSKTKRDI